MFSLGNNGSLIFEDNSNHRIEIKESLLKELDEHSVASFPEGSTIIYDREEMDFYKVSFADKSILVLFRDSIRCHFKKINASIHIFSFEHLKLILNSLNYNCPVYFSNKTKRQVFIDITKIEETKINFEVDEVEIEEYKEEYEQKSKDIFNKANNLYKQSKNNEVISYEYISQNFNNYFSHYNTKVENLTSDFEYIITRERRSIHNDINSFLSNLDVEPKKEEKKENSEEINYSHVYPVCGPHGTGKTITALRIHKSLFTKNIKGIYINLKYYSNNEIKWENKIDNLIKECFFIIDEQSELLDLYKRFIKLNDIYEAIEGIIKFTENKNKKIFFILDQFQNKYNPNNNLLQKLSNYKIFLLSSINDFDVKLNLIYKFEEEVDKENNNNYEKILSKKIRVLKYNYIENLINKDYYRQQIFINIVKNKIRKYEKDENQVEIEYEYVNSVLEKFSYLPKYFFGYINFYDSISDLLYVEYSNIIKKLDLYLYQKTIDLDEINKLIKNNYLTEKDSKDAKTLKKKIFVEYLRVVPLKYINFTQFKNGEFCFYYSFPFFKKIYDDFNDYVKNKNLFYTTKIESQRGIFFESILKMELRAFQKLNVDGYLEVNSLLKMEPTPEYQIVNTRYFASKNNIFINQITQAKAFDLAIYKPQKKQLILIQSKYIINDNTLKLGKWGYTDCAIEAKNSFNRISKESIENVYFLFMSSYFYNFVDKEKILSEKLVSKKINCLFYSIKNNYFTYDFSVEIPELQCTETLRIVPYPDYYEEQKAFGKINSKIRKQKVKIDKKEKTLLQKKKLISVDLNDLHREIIDFIKKRIVDKDNIINNLGLFKKIKNFNAKNKTIKLDKDKEYCLLLNLTKFGKFDLNKNLGLIYYDNLISYYYDFIEIKNYDNFEKLIDQFDNLENNCYYIIGVKSEKSNYNDKKDNLTQI